MILLIWLRSVVATVIALIVTPIWSSAGVVVSLIGAPIYVQDWVIYSWCRIILKLFGVELTAEGQENLPKEGVIFVFNHTSFFDIPAFYGAVRKTARFGAKHSLFKIPFFGQGLKAMGFLPIVRHAREKVLNLYNQSIQRMKAGESFVLAGEGSRLKRDSVGDRLKAGPFIFAINGEAKIVPIVINGAHDVMAKGDWLPATRKWNHKIHVQILPPVASKGFTLDSRTELQDIVRDKMKQAHQNYLDNSPEHLKATKDFQSTSC